MSWWRRQARKKERSFLALSKAVVVVSVDVAEVRLENIVENMLMFYLPMHLRTKYTHLFVVNSRF